VSYFEDNEDEIIYGRRHDRDDDEPRKVECKKCGKGGLEWEDDNGRWVLIESNGKVHKCDEKRVHAAVADDFEVLDE
jgi:hypothetical protein